MGSGSCVPPKPPKPPRPAAGLTVLCRQRAVCAVCVVVCAVVKAPYLSPRAAPSANERLAPLTRGRHTDTTNALGDGVGCAWDGRRDGGRGAYSLSYMADVVHMTQQRDFRGSSYRAPLNYCCCAYSIAYNKQGPAYYSYITRSTLLPSDTYLVVIIFFTVDSTLMYTLTIYEGPY